MGNRVLVVAGEPELREAISDMLERSEYGCAFAPGFKEAIHIAAAAVLSFDILLTDVMLNPFHGRDLANRLVGLHPGLKVLFMSGFPPRWLRDYGALPAYAPFLGKPFTRNELTHALDGLAKGTPSWLDLVAFSAGKENTT